MPKSSSARRRRLSRSVERQRGVRVTQARRTKPGTQTRPSTAATYSHETTDFLEGQLTDDSPGVAAPRCFRRGNQRPSQPAVEAEPIPNERSPLGFAMVNRASAPVVQLPSLNASVSNVTSGGRHSMPALRQVPPVQVPATEEEAFSGGGRSSPSTPSDAESLTSKIASFPETPAPTSHGGHPLEILDSTCPLAKRVYFCRTPWSFKEHVECVKLNRPSIEDVLNHLQEIRERGNRKFSNWIVWELNMNKEPIRNQFADSFNQQILPYRLPALGVAPLSVLIDFCSSILWWLELDFSNAVVIMYQDNHAQFLYFLAGLILNLNTAAARRPEQPLRQMDVPSIDETLLKMKQMGNPAIPQAPTAEPRYRRLSSVSKLGWIAPEHWGATYLRYLKYYHSLLNYAPESESKRLRAYALKSILVDEWIGPAEGMVIEIYHTAPTAIEHGKLKFKKESKGKSRLNATESLPSKRISAGGRGIAEFHLQHVASSPSITSYKDITPIRRASIPVASTSREQASLDNASHISSKADADFDEWTWGSDAVQAYLKYRKENKSHEKQEPLLNVFGLDRRTAKSTSKPAWDDVGTFFIPTTDTKKANQVASKYHEQTNTCSAAFNFKECPSRRGSHRGSITRPTPRDVGPPEPVILCGDVLVVLRQTEPQAEEEVKTWLAGSSLHKTLEKKSSYQLFEKGQVPKTAIKHAPPLLAIFAFHTSFIEEEALCLTSEDFDFFHETNFEKRRICAPSSFCKFKVNIFLGATDDGQKSTISPQINLESPADTDGGSGLTSPAPSQSQNLQEANASSESRIQDILKQSPIDRVPMLDLKKTQKQDGEAEPPPTTTRALKKRGYFSRLTAKKRKDSESPPPRDDRVPKSSRVMFLKGARPKPTPSHSLTYWDPVKWQILCENRIRKISLPTHPAPNIYEFYRRHIRTPEDGATEDSPETIEYLTVCKLCSNFMDIIHSVEFYFGTDLPSATSRDNLTTTSVMAIEPKPAKRSSEKSTHQKRQKQKPWYSLGFVDFSRVKWLQPGESSKSSHRSTKQKSVKHDSTFETSLSTQSIDGYPSAFASPSASFMRGSSERKKVVKKASTESRGLVSEGGSCDRPNLLLNEDFVEDDYLLVLPPSGQRKRARTRTSSEILNLSPPMPGSPNRVTLGSPNRVTLGSPVEALKVAAPRPARLSIARPSAIHIDAVEMQPPKPPPPRRRTSSPHLAVSEVNITQTLPVSPQPKTVPPPEAPKSEELRTNADLMKPKMPLPFLADLTRGSCPPGDSTAKATAAPKSSAKKPPPSRKSDGPAKKKAPPPKSGALETLFAKKAAPPVESQPKAKAPLGRRLFWKPLPPDLVKDTIFDELSGDDLRASMEFSVDTGVANRVFVKDVKKKAPAAKKVESEEKVYETIFDRTRAQNLGIIVRRLRFSPEVYGSTLLRLTLADQMAGDDLQKLETLMVTAEEDKEFDAYLTKFKGDLSNLRPSPERQLISLRPSQIPRMTQRYNILIFNLRRTKEVKDFREQLELLRQACSEMRGSRTFRHILAAVLRWGNFVNYGSQKQAEMQIKGITLASLLKLTEFKTTIDQNVTSLHYILATMIALSPDSGIANLVNELRSVRSASRVSGEALDISWKTLSDGLTLLKTERKNFEPSYTPIPDPKEEGAIIDRGLTQLDRILNMSEAEIFEAERLARETLNTVMATAKFFGDDSASPQMLHADFSTAKISFQYGTLFQTFQAFLQKYEEAVRDILKRPAVYVKLVPEDQIMSLIQFVEKTTGKPCPASIKPGPPPKPAEPRKLMPVRTAEIVTTTSSPNPTDSPSPPARPSRPSSAASTKSDSACLRQNSALPPSAVLTPPPSRRKPSLMEGNKSPIPTTVTTTSPDRTGMSAAIRFSHRSNMLPPPAPAGLYTLTKR